MIAKVDPKSTQPIAVKWVGNATPGLAVKPGVQWPTNTPDGLYTWRGGIHFVELETLLKVCLLYTSPSPRDQRGSRMPSSA